MVVAGAASTALRQQQQQQLDSELRWYPQYAVELALQPVLTESDPVTGDVRVAVCKFCKLLGREDGIQKVTQPQQFGAVGSRSSAPPTFRKGNIVAHHKRHHASVWTMYKQQVVHGESSVDEFFAANAAMKAENEQRAAQDAQERRIENRRRANQTRRLRRKRIRQETPAQNAAAGRRRKQPKYLALLERGTEEEWEAEANALRTVELQYVASAPDYAAEMAALWLPRPAGITEERPELANVCQNDTNAS